jgi:hypothetical protein
LFREYAADSTPETLEFSTIRRSVKLLADDLQDTSAIPVEENLVDFRNPLRSKLFKPNAGIPADSRTGSPERGRTLRPSHTPPGLQGRTSPTGRVNGSSVAPRQSFPKCDAGAASSSKAPSSPERKNPFAKLSSGLPESKKNEKPGLSEDDELDDA